MNSAKPWRSASLPEADRDLCRRLIRIITAPGAETLDHAFPADHVRCRAIIGTGIFFVLAERVPVAGPAVLFSFLIAGFAAGLTALCYLRK